MSISILSKITSTIQDSFVQGQTEQVKQSFTTLRVAAIAAAIISSLGGVVLSSLAVSLSGVTFGFSTFLLLPAGALFIVSFDSYKVVRCCDIILERVMESNGYLASVYTGIDLISSKPLWVSRIEREVNSSLLLDFFLNLPSEP